MIIDSNTFFKKMTLNICSSLDLNVAMRRSLDYLREVFPVDEISMNILDSRLGAIRIVSRAALDDSRPASELVTLPDDFWQWFKEQAPSGPIIVTEEVRRTIPPHFKEMFPHQHEASEMVIPLNLENVKIGVLILFAPGDVAYTKEHLDLMASVVEPFAIALSNAIAYQELIRYRDTLIDDKDFLQKELILSDRVIGEQSGLKTVMDQVNQVAPLNNTVLILGETGVGKEVIANAIHQRSHRRNGPFIKVNCGAISDNLIDSELFGYEKGAFTGATSQKRGRFERANGGTIFLDEVGELSQNAQVRLLRVLANHEIERVGGNKVIPVDIRVITATHRNLAKMVAEGRFREDLWFRLNVFPLVVPPLRERKDDIPALLNYFLNMKSRELGISPPTVSPKGINRLMSYSWPGNVRELENVIERELIRGPYSEMTFESVVPAPQPTQAPVRIIQESSSARETGELASLDEVMKKHIQRVLKTTGGKVNGPGGAAEILKINPNTLRSRMDKYKINYGGRK
ncbi:Fis family transcriptional regulator [Deltaproteobacteria bacterium Smac51]|nr:Fis family transcriptional regulator [Deltaproteobacteria bacterium Smac51]